MVMVNGGSIVVEGGDGDGEWRACGIYGDTPRPR